MNARIGSATPSSASGLIGARKLSRDVPQLAVPEDVIRRLDADPSAGVAIAADLVTSIQDTGAFDGVHLIPVSRYREISARLLDLGLRS